MIIACNSCPAQYSVPDAKVQGKKVRITCKRCSAAIIVDATQMPAQAPAAPPAVLPEFEPPRLEVAEPVAPSLPADDVTTIAPPKPSAAFSVHDEPTVIGQIPREALEFERAFAQRTLPPPAAPAPASQAPVTSPPDAPTALVALEVAPTPRPLDPMSDDATLISGAPTPNARESAGEGPRGSRGALIAFLLLAALLVAFAILKPH